MIERMFASAPAACKAAPPGGPRMSPERYGKWMTLLVVLVVLVVVIVVSIVRAQPRTILRPAVVVPPDVRHEGGWVVRADRVVVTVVPHVVGEEVPDDPVPRRVGVGEDTVAEAASRYLGRLDSADDPVVGDGVARRRIDPHPLLVSPQVVSVDLDRPVDLEDDDARRGHA